jgi:chemotaxis protein MotA
MDPSMLWDLRAAAFVLGGTLLGTFMRCGIRQCAITLRALGSLGKHQRGAWELRAELAGQVEEIRRDGPLRAELRHLRDREFEDATDALIKRRSIGALLERHEAYKADREALSQAARDTLVQAAELAPVMGLAGTLVSLATLRGTGIRPEVLGDAIGMAVTTTLYGLLIAHLLFAPLAEVVARRARAEERARQSVIDWLAEQLAPAFEKHKLKVVIDDAHDGVAS